MAPVFTTEYSDYAQLVAQGKFFEYPGAATPRPFDF